MAKIQTKVSMWARIAGWMRRHKVLTVFGILVAAVGLWLLEGEVVLQVQIHYERARFAQMDHNVRSLGQGLARIGNPTRMVKSSCDYTSDGSVFGYKYLSCGTEYNIFYSGMSKTDAQSVIAQDLQSLRSAGVQISENSHGMGKNDLAVYVFDEQQIPCGFAATYYDEETLISSRFSAAPQTGKVLYLSLACAESAKAEYFPVSN